MASFAFSLLDLFVLLRVIPVGGPVLEVLGHFSRGRPGTLETCGEVGYLFHQKGSAAQSGMA